MNSNPGKKALDNFREVFDGITTADEKAAKAALGIRDETAVRAMDVSKLALLITAQPVGDSLQIIAQANIDKRDAARVLRQIADSWDQEWKAAAHAEQKRLRESQDSQ